MSEQPQNIYKTKF